ncbi:MAG: family transcriptional regulator, cyclic receptor protein [Acidimicrobiaceae bacterium]
MDHTILQDLSEDDRRRVLAATNRRRFSKGATLFYEGDPGESLHLLDKGRVAIRVSTPLGDVGTLSVLGPGESFGEQALVDETSKRSATAVAMDTVETLTLDRVAFDELRKGHPSIDQVLVRTLAEQVRRLSTLVIEALYLPAETRLLRRLSELASLFASGDAEVLVPITQEELSTMAGTTRPTANRVLRAGVDQGYVRLERGRIVVLDRERLAKAAR